MSDPFSRIPASPSFEQVQKQAKDLLRQFRAGEPAALERFRSAERFSGEDASGIRLADAQFIIAREYGFESWARLKRYVEELQKRLRDPRSAPLFFSSAPPFFQIDWQDNRLSVQGPQTAQHWNTIVSVAKEYRIGKITAEGVTDDGMERLATLDDVTHLDIGGSKTLTDDGVRHLVRMPQLLDLEMGGSASVLTDRALEPLRRLTGLRRFHAAWTKGISDAGMTHLVDCSLLEDVSLMGTATGDGALQALTDKPGLRMLATGRNVTDAGLRLLHRFPVFKTWRGGEVRYGLMSFRGEPNHLLLDGPFTDAGLASLSGLDGLFGLGFFRHCPAFTSAGLAGLRQLPNLGFLGCQNEHCNDEAMRHIANIPRLRVLMGQGAVAGDRGFEAISRSSTIEYLWGRECPNLTSRGFAALAAMPALRGLGVSCKNVDDASLSMLPRFPALLELMPMDVTDEGFRHVGRCDTLERLWCMYCRETGDAATEHIAALTRLRTYYAGMTKITDRSLDLLSRMVSLESLEFWQCAGLTSAGIARLASLPQLCEISLHGLSGVTKNVLALFPARVRASYSG